MPVSDDLRRLELAQLDMTAGLFAVLDNILSSIVPPPPLEIKAGGYPEEIFATLTEEDKEQFECSICYMILKEAQQCKNKHKFCSSCIMAWTFNSTSLGADKCPVCRTDGNYVPCDIMNARLSYKRVKCQKEECDWTGFLKDFESHEHNRYDAPINADVKRSLPAIPGTSRSSSISSTTGPGPGAIPRPGGVRGASNQPSDDISGEAALVPHPPSTPRNLGGPSVARRSSNASTTQASQGETANSNRANARPTPRVVRQANRLAGNNPSTTAARRNSMPAMTNGPPNTGARRNSNPVPNAGTNPNATSHRTSNPGPSVTNRPNNTANRQSGTTPSNSTTRRPSNDTIQANRNPSRTTPNSVVRASQEASPRTTQSPTGNQDASASGAAETQTAGQDTSATQAPTVSQDAAASGATTQASGSQTTTTLASNENASSLQSPRQAAGTQTQTSVASAGTSTAATPRATAGGQTTLLSRRRSTTPNRFVLPQRTTSDAVSTTTTAVANGSTNAANSSTNAVNSSTNAANSSTNASNSSTAAAGSESQQDGARQPNHRPAQLPPITAATMGNNGQRVYRQNQFRQMASQIREGRSQLQDIMLVLNGELEARRESISSYQQFQERQHRERLRQLQEVHTLGRRLGEVAGNLAVLVDGIRGANARRRGQNDGNDTGSGSNHGNGSSS